MNTEFSPSEADRTTFFQFGNNKLMILPKPQTRTKNMGLRDVRTAARTFESTEKLRGWGRPDLIGLSGREVTNISQIRSANKPEEEMRLTILLNMGNYLHSRLPYRTVTYPTPGI